jgi:NAD(P)-dependent dehydrogenase (short-subunit alcohol dehydrogenase family)
MKTVAVVLGGSRGLGAELAKLLAIDSEVINVARSSNQNAQTNIHCDLADETSVKTALVELKQACNGREVAQFYWVAGYLYRSEFTSASIEQLNQMIDINFRNPLRIVQWAQKLMLQQTSSSSLIMVDQQQEFQKKRALMRLRTLRRKLLRSRLREPSGRVTPPLILSLLSFAREA